MYFDLLNYTDCLTEELQKEGIVFNRDGFPVFPEAMLMKNIPDDLVMCPFSQRLQIPQKHNILLCSYENDTRIFRHMKKLKKYAEEGKKYFGTAGFDLSPRTGTDVAYQRLILLANQLATLRLGLDGCRIVPNFRIGSINTIHALKSYPVNIWYTVGVLGCYHGDIAYNIAYLKTKIAFANPYGLLIYGQLRKEYQEVLEESCVRYRVFEDFQRVSRRNSQLKREAGDGSQN